MLEFITTKTGGNPFFIENLILDMRECGTLAKNAEGVWHLNEQGMSDVPVSISAVLTTRLIGCPCSSRRLCSMRQCWDSASNSGFGIHAGR